MLKELKNDLSDRDFKDIVAKLSEISIEWNILKLKDKINEMLENKSIYINDADHLKDYIIDEWDRKIKGIFKEIFNNIAFKEYDTYNRRAIGEGNYYSASKVEYCKTDMDIAINFTFGINRILSDIEDEKLLNLKAEIINYKRKLNAYKTKINYASHINSSNRNSKVYSKNKLKDIFLYFTLLILYKTVSN